eukprot:TRINITY_DN21243_c0_g1_i1.p1 TRINITY_DN21243_c0_g1~~TRINITY_DN21243_c0_g1_i1.p1  ORF type:complete len:258 (+),score=45.40 TRINITY_DN21243_c0_g1_i1:71-844(+)
MYILLSTFLIAAAVASETPANSAHVQLDFDSIFLALGSAAGGIVLSVFLIALCAGKKDQPTKQLHSVAVERNVQPTISPGDNVHDIEDGPQARVSQDMTDEDALANARQSASMATAMGTDHSSKMIGSGGDQLWLHYTTRRKEAEELLRQEATDSGQSGIFLVRAKKEDQGQYALDIAWQDEASSQVVTSHHRVHRAANGTFEMDDQSYEACTSLEALIQYLMNPKNKYFHKPLTRYLPRSESDNAQASQSNAQSAA